MRKYNLIRSIVVLLLILSMLFGLSVNAFAYAGTPTITPQWNSIHCIDLDMVFVDGEGTVAAASIKQSTSDFIEGTLYMYLRYNENEDWTYMYEWYDSEYIGTLAISGDFDCESGITYRAVFVVTAYTNGVPETETIEYIEKCP